jgi:hypothetical protein
MTGRELSGMVHTIEIDPRRGKTVIGNADELGTQGKVE